MNRQRLFVISLLSVIHSGCGDTVTSNYATYADAEKDNLFDRGWLPDILPVSTANIRTKNSLDDNASRGSFEIPKPDIDVFKSKLRRLDNGQYAFSYGEIMKDPTWVFSVDENEKQVSYVLSSN